QIAQAPKAPPLALSPSLAFELNSRLPQSTLNLPPMDKFSITAPPFTGVFLASELDSPLTPLAKIPPIYPLRAARRGIQGWVRVQFVVNTSGGVENPEILEADPDQIFDASVINCVAQWKFKPGTMEGVAVSTLAQTTIKFQLE
ncbi:MAG: energy transducer TonB, partial [Proteobacteria bacterium]|nr:energy transducer TonB [Pseudomonadota bacterium]